MVRAGFHHDRCSSSWGLLPQEGHPVVWMCSLTNYRGAERGQVSPLKEYPLGSGAWRLEPSRPALVPPAHTPSSVGQAQDASSAPSGGPHVPCLPLQASFPLLSPLPCKHGEVQQGWALPGGRRDKEGLRVCSAGRVEGKGLGRLQESGLGTAWTRAQTSWEVLKAPLCAPVDQCCGSRTCTGMHLSSP